MGDFPDTVEKRAQYFATTAALCFQAEANSIVERSKDRENAKGLGDYSNQASTYINLSFQAVSAAGGAAVGAFLGGPPGAMAAANCGKKGGEVAGSVITGSIDYFFKVKDHKDCKDIHKKYLTAFEPSEQLEELVTFFYDIFTCHNVQFHGMLTDLKDSWENAMNKLAMETVNRQDYFSHDQQMLIHKISSKDYHD